MPIINSFELVFSVFIYSITLSIIILLFYQFYLFELIVQIIRYVNVNHNSLNEQKNKINSFEVDLFSSIEMINKQLIN